MRRAGPEESCIKKFVRWLIERTGASDFTKTIIPRHALHPMYSLGGLASLMFFLLAFTGIIQLMFYTPAFGEENIAYESVRHFTESVPYGFVVRGIHSYAATLLVLLSMLHFLRVYFTGAYAKPRELTYVVGIAAGLFSIASAFLGYSLRMDHISVEAMRIGQFLVLQLPGGNWLYSLIFGSGSFDEIIPRFLALHIGVAGLIGVVLLLHFYMIHAHHISPPYDDNDPEPAIPFYPNFLLTELAAAVVVIGALVMFSAAFPPELGFKFVFGEELPVGQPEWYLMALYALIKTGIDPVLAGFVIPSIGLLIFVIMPWVDPLYSRHPMNRRIATTYGLIFVGEYVMLFMYGQLTPGEQIPLINALLLSIAVATVMGYVGIRLTSRPVPPKRTPKQSSNGNPSYAVRVLLKNVWWIAGLLLALALVLGGLGMMSHLSESYYDAAMLFGGSIILLGWAFFVAKVGLVDAKYLT
ncbi:MAG: cytochrome b N-terminal domain-containing protein [Nitrososphaerota archaeon]